MLREFHVRALRGIEASENGFALASVKADGTAEDVSFHKGSAPVGRYHGGPFWLSGSELKEAMILSIARGRIVDLTQAPGAASPATFYRMDIVRMIRDRRLNGLDEEADLLEQYRAVHPDVFIA